MSKNEYQIFDHHMAIVGFYLLKKKFLYHDIMRNFINEDEI